MQDQTKPSTSIKMLLFLRFSSPLPSLSLRRWRCGGVSGWGGGKTFQKSALSEGIEREMPQGFPSISGTTVSFLGNKARWSVGCKKKQPSNPKQRLARRQCYYAT